MIKELKDFLFKGNVLDLAVAVPLCYIVPSVFTNSDKGKYKGKKNL